jgi:histidinol dehydrogenase
LIRVEDLDAACALANRIAPEHLELPSPTPRAAPEDSPRRRDLHGAPLVGGARRLLRRTEPRAAHRSHGALFVAARRLRFPETLECIEPVAEAARTLGPVAATLARGEGLEAHAQSALYRVE